MPYTRVPNPGVVRVKAQVLRWSASMAVFCTIILPLMPRTAAQQKQAKELFRPTLETPKTMHYLNTRPGVAYVGSHTCGKCHQAIFREFEKTAMARSMSLPYEYPDIVAVSKPVTFFDRKLNEYFEIYHQGKVLYQSIYQLDQNQGVVFRHTEKITYVMGTGLNGIGYVIRRGNYLFQAPLAYYTKMHNWSLSPWGGQYAFGFSRPITAGCVVCHSGRARPVLGTQGRYKNPPFAELGIGCENCHGPGQLHVEERLGGAPLPKGVDHTIVDPSKLPGWLANNICMSCHQEGAAAVLKPGKHFLDFRPGTPLDETVALLKLPLDNASNTSLPLLDHYSEMAMSKCYRSSGGRLKCITCHDPHFQPTTQQAVGYYRKRCLTCHMVTSCGLPLLARSKENDDNCFGCHMPRTGVKFVAHAAVTNHRIIAYPNEPYPKAAFQDTSQTSLGLIHLDRIPNKKTANLPPLVLLKAYAEILQEHPSNALMKRYWKLLDRCARIDPKNSFVLSALAHKEAKSGTKGGTAEAVRDLDAAIKNGSTEPSDRLMLADLLARLGRSEQSIDVLKAGVAADPYVSVFYLALAIRFAKAGHVSEALGVINKALILFPEDPFLRQFGEKLKGAGMTPHSPSVQP